MTGLGFSVHSILLLLGQYGMAWTIDFLFHYILLSRSHPSLCRLDDDDIPYLFDDDVLPLGHLGRVCVCGSAESSAPPAGLRGRTTLTFVPLSWTRRRMA